MNIGILVDTTDNNQEAFLSITQGNVINLNQVDKHIVLFFRDISAICSKFIGTIAALEKAYHSDCHLIATTIELAQHALNAYNNKKKILYLGEIEWLHGKSDYLYNCLF